MASAALDMNSQNTPVRLQATKSVNLAYSYSPDEASRRHKAGELCVQVNYVVKRFSHARFSQALRSAMLAQYCTALHQYQRVHEKGDVYHC